MPNFSLDSRLQADCVGLGKLELSHLLLMNKSELPWFVLVPETDVIEIVDLNEQQQQSLYKEIAQISKLVRNAFEIDKLNVAAIGNVVSQLHVHVVGRRKTDSCWPAPVWGNIQSEAYNDQELEKIKALPELQNLLH